MKRIKTTYLENEILQIDIIKITHESKSIDHAERSTIYDKINRHYY